MIFSYELLYFMQCCFLFSNREKVMIIFFYDRMEGSTKVRTLRKFMKFLTYMTVFVLCPAWCTFGFIMAIFGANITNFRNPTILCFMATVKTIETSLKFHTYSQIMSFFWTSSANNILLTRRSDAIYFSNSGIIGVNNLHRPLINLHTFLFLFLLNIAYFF